MKKISLLLLLNLFAFTGFAQVTLGLRVAPAICMDRVKDLNNADGYTYSNNGSGVRFAIGPTIDFKFGDNYAFSTGIWYLSNRAGLNITQDPTYNPQGSVSLMLAQQKQKDVVSIQSIQIPVTFKVYTNEIATNLKLYFQLGGLATINFYEKQKESTPAITGNYQNKYDVFNASLYAGAGVTYKVGSSNELFGGFYYNRGLLNMMNGHTDPFTKNKYNAGAKYNMDLVGLEVGVTF